MDEKWKSRFQHLCSRLQEIHEEVNQFDQPWQDHPPEKICPSVSRDFYISNDMDYVVDNENKAKELWGDRFFHCVRVEDPNREDD